jgi:phenylpropionate dioxygenase-like ring-hydroxylating dioxygenase large terminal subunit
MGLRNGTLEDGMAIADLFHGHRVHRLAYTSPEVFDLEMSRLFGKTWVYVGHASEVARPGDFKTTKIGREPVLLIRDDSEQVTVLFNRCAHRGAVVCRQERGSANRLRCLYHGWTYSTSGELVGVPFRQGYDDDFDPSELGLARAPRVETYRGFVFASLNPAVEPLTAHLGGARPYLDAAVDAAPDGEIVVTSGVHKHAYHGNWKLHLENFVDSYHPSFTHEATFARRVARTGVQPGRADTGSHNVALGHGHALIDYLAARDGPRRDRHGVNLAIFPNLLVCTPHRDIRIIRPIRVDFTETLTYHYRLKGAPVEVNRQAVRTTTLAIGAAGLVQPDDFEAYERIQEGLAVSCMDWTHFGRGLQREQVQPNGEIRGMGADEVGNRGQHREYRRLLLQEPRPCCTPDGTCRRAQAEVGALQASRA